MRSASAGRKAEQRAFGPQQWGGDMLQRVQLASEEALLSLMGD
ncbi:MAG: hypothetical protein OXI12_14280 [Gammaproteobacteria bacterium]|nr:hypothetical protein [Gammaproteobacteria bacterium]